ncbi:MAG: DNA-3-methyladenine glycosylase [Lutisporaceae bacterium]
MILLEREFYTRDTITVSKELLGKVLVHKTKEYSVAGRIVDAEAYMGPLDKAAHSYGGRKTPRVEIMYHEGGYSYVFTIYGMYQCFNIVTEKVGKPQAVLIRALEPVAGLELMAQNRFNMDYRDLSNTQIKGLTNGPGKLCIAMKIGKEQNKIDICHKNGVDDIYVYDDGYSDFEVDASPRINIDYAEEYVLMPWRFFIKGNKYVSK